MQMTTKWGVGKTVLACSLAGIIVTVAIAFAIPVHYVWQGMLTVAPADESSLSVLDHLGHDIFSRESLAEIIQQHNLYPRERARLPLSDVIDKVKSGVSVRAVGPEWPWSRNTLTFAIAFDYPDRQVAQKVGNELVSAFMEGIFDQAKSHPNGSHATFEVRDIAEKPVGPNRAAFAGGGLLAGLLGGAIVAIISRSRRDTAVCPTCGQRVAAHVTGS
jgi:capsular polysaccharide biosynthesis protein